MGADRRRPRRGGAETIRLALAVALVLVPAPGGASPRLAAPGAWAVGRAVPIAVADGRARFTLPTHLPGRR